MRYAHIDKSNICDGIWEVPSSIDDKDTILVDGMNVSIGMKYDKEKNSWGDIEVVEVEEKEKELSIDERLKTIESNQTATLMAIADIYENFTKVN